MKGLIIKDFLFMKTQARILSLLFIFYLFISFMNKNTAIFSMLSCMLIPLMAASCSAYDESVKWNRFACSLPFSRAQIVKARYASLLILLSLFTLFSLLIDFLYVTITKTGSFQIAFVVAISVSISLLSISAIVPLLIKFGSEKARLVMIIFIIIPMALLPQLVENTSLDIVGAIKNIPLPLILILAAILLLLLLFASYYISLKVFAKKDF